MTHVLLFHHALGVTPGIRAIAGELRAAGHSVTVPDLFDGATFADVETGVAHAEQIGFDTITDRGVATAEGFAAELVVIGFSLGVLPAQKLAQTRRGVRGAVLCHAAIPLGLYAEGWPDEVAVQLHLVENDPLAEEDLEAACEIAATAARGDLYVYPGTGHLITDSSAADYDPPVAKQIMERTLALLAELK